MNKIINKLRLCRETHTSILGFIVSSFINAVWNLFFFKCLKKKGERIGYKTADGTEYQLHMLFFHTLVNDTSKCFAENLDNEHNFESWNLTVKEFSSFLEELYSRGYIIVDMKDFLDGKLQIPVGRTPIMISFDEVNYRTMMKGYGFPERLTVDEDGNLIYVMGDEKENRTDADHIGILEHFIEKHPDFSLNGARAILGLTGHDGIFGYRDMDDSELKKLVKTLKDKGYKFACHSYSHNHMEFSDKNPNGFSGITDTRKWLKTICPVTGKTDCFITPFGVDIRHDPILLLYLKLKGFRYFLSVGKSRTAVKHKECYYADRINIDGITFRKRTVDYEKYYCNPYAVYDKDRKIPLK